MHYHVAIYMLQDHKPHTYKHYAALFLAVLGPFTLHSSVKLRLCSLKWDHAWNVDYWLHALDATESFPKYTHPVYKNDVMCENSTCQYSAGKSSPLMDCPCWDIMHNIITKSWASKSVHKLSFIDLKVVVGRIYINPVIFQELGIGI